MPLRVEIPDGDLKGFSHPAQERLTREIDLFASDIIQEANRIEAAHHMVDGDPEITANTVQDAVSFVRRGLAAKKKKAGTIVLRISAAVLPLIVGIMYDETKLQNSLYLVFFIVLVAAAIFVVTLTTAKE